MIQVLCVCGEVFNADPVHVGRSIKCRRCGTLVEIKWAAAAPPSPPPSAPPSLESYFPAGYSQAQKEEALDRWSADIRWQKAWGLFRPHPGPPPPAGPVVREPVQQEDLFGKPQIVEEKQRTPEDGSARPNAPPSVPEVRRYPERGSPLNGSYDPSDSGPLTRDDALAAARTLLSRSGSPWVLDEAAARHYRRPPDALRIYRPRREMPCWVIPVVPDHPRVGGGQAVVVWDDTGTVEVVTFGE